MSVWMNHGRSRGASLVMMIILLAVGFGSPVKKAAAGPTSVKALKTELDSLQHDLSAALAHEESKKPAAVAMAAQERTNAKARAGVGATEDVFVEAPIGDALAAGAPDTAGAEKNDMTLMMMWGGAAGAGIALLVMFAVCSVTTTKCLLRIAHNTATSTTACFKAMGSALLDCWEAVVSVLDQIAERLRNTYEDVTTWLEDTCCSCC